ncbi:ATP-binding protein [Belliella sp. DSM 111904]|uniref:ATP-binding protein n=1 Tax=Belliella filtrata TaxID=2923435 RepID=A0ABS9V0R9_9BACT|nr:AVAST type 2 anti-phage system protein Avs2 [Belliella filtrata]MCH7409918.1 ATP-binding protein [Belliella filtrata]
MNKLEKIKPLVEWILSWVFKLRLRKTYWSISVPLALVILGEIANKLEFVVKVTAKLYQDANDTWLEVFWGAIHFWVSISLPWWSILLIIILLLLFTYVWLQEIKAKKTGIEVTVESITGNIFNRLSKDIDDKIEGIKSELTFQPNQDWFKEQCKSSIDDLGKRYTPELNVKLEISEIFEGLGRTNQFKRKVTKQFDQFLIKGKKVLKNQPEVKESLESLENEFDELQNLFHNTDFLGTAPIPISDFEDLLNKSQSSVQDIYNYYITEERKVQKEKKDYQYYHKYGTELRNIREFEHELSTFQNLIHGSSFKLANNPFLLLDGEAGIGKSHLIGDIVSRRIRKEHESVFLLGQHFVTEEDPWTQIFKRLQINSKSADFLRKLNKRAEESGKRIVLFIDAINEGKGNYFWNEFVISFINDIKKYEWLGLVFTIRTSYKNLIFPEEERSSLEIVEHHHYGFRNIEYEASKLFFDNYSIELPSVPFLHPEFQNPLFLKLFCEGINKAGLTRIPDGLQGITSIINFFVKNVNIVLSKPKRVGYSDSLNLVLKSINALIKCKVDNELRYVPYEQAYEVVNEAISSFIDKIGFIDELITEGVISKNLFWKEADDYEEGVYLAYERFEDHLTVQYLLEQYPELEKDFKENGKLYKYVENENAVYRYKGLIEAFSIQIPEIKGYEFYSLIPDLKDKYPIVESFVESLLWRKVDTINEESKKYVNEHALSYQGTHDYFWETILAVTAIPNHFFNAHSLHNHLLKFSLADRDANWTQLLKYKYDNESSVKQLIDWAWSETDKSHISDESVLLSSITLSWFHTSTNRKLRDCSTKALICLLQNRLNVLLELLKMFEGVNDPYVYDRLFAVAYGCAVRTNKKEELAVLSDYIYITIFKDKDEVYPHVLLRDYARGVIEFTSFSGTELPFDIEDVRPPYRSLFPHKIVTNKKIDKKYKFDYDAKDFKKHYWSQNSILSSMTTEYGRGTGGYGDFGRYTFESALSSWDVNTNQLSNLAVEWIFEKYGYDVEKHGEYDRNTNSYERRASTIERIGKKYQWIALYEMVARVSDNFKKYERWSFEKEKEVPYQGPWDPYIRDIDPTLLISETGSYDEDEPRDFWWVNNKIFNWDCTNKSWVNDSNVLPKMEEIIQVKDDLGEEWLVLEGYPSWSEPKKIGEEKWDQPHKELWCHIRSYLVKNDEYDSFKDWAIEQEFMGRWMPESRDRYEMFSREYYWSPAQDYFMSELYGGTEWTEVHDRKSREYVAEVHVTAQSFLWEEEFDKSKEEPISFLKPSTVIHKGMDLKYSPREGEFVDDAKVAQCFAPNVYHNSKSYLLVRKHSFLKFLNKNNLKVVWTVLGEKQIIGGRSFGTEYHGRLEISGAYYFENEKLNGTIKTKKT